MKLFSIYSTQFQYCAMLLCNLETMLLTSAMVHIFGILKLCCTVLRVNDILNCTKPVIRERGSVSLFRDGKGIFDFTIVR